MLTVIEPGRTDVDLLQIGPRAHSVGRIRSGIDLVHIDSQLRQFAHEALLTEIFRAVNGNRRPAWRSLHRPGASARRACLWTDAAPTGRLPLQLVPKENVLRSAGAPV